jgi:hypothetical protein
MYHLYFKKFHPARPAVSYLNKAWLEFSYLQQEPGN